MQDQNNKDLECLNHFIRNNLVNIQGCFRQIENYLRVMHDAAEKFEGTFSENIEENMDHD